MQTNIKGHSQNLEELAKTLDPGLSKMEEWLRAIELYGHSFISQLSESPAFIDNAQAGKQIWEAEIKEDPQPMEEVLQTFKESVELSGLNPATGRFMGYIPGGGLYPSALGDYLAAIMNRYSGAFFANPGAASMENKLCKWVCELMAYPEEAIGCLTSGGSMATLTCMHTAREHFQIKAADFHRLVIYLTDQTHHVIPKALHIAGMRESVLRNIPMDEDYRMKTDLLEESIQQDLQDGLQPFMIVGSVGTTNTGSVDPIAQLAELSEQYGLWLHIDAAYGGFFKLTSTAQHHFDGVERSHSLVIDPHKGLFLPYGTGMAIVRKQEWLQKAHRYMADYMQDIEVSAHELSPMDISAELTKHFRGLRMWLPLQLFGLKAFRSALEEKLVLTQYAYQEIANIPDMEMGPKPQLSVIIFRYIPPNGSAIDEANKKIAQWIQQRGKIFFSTTSLKGDYYLRVAILSFRTHKAEVDLLIEELNNAIDQVC